MSVEFPMLDPIPEFKNYCDRKGAEDLKSKIEVYWAMRGKRVQVWVEQKAFSSAMRGAYWVVRSDLCDGKPTAAPAEDRRAA